MSEKQIECKLARGDHSSVISIGDKVTCGGKDLLIIGGPCTVESPEQMEIVKEKAELLEKRFGKEKVCAEVIEGYVKDSILEAAKLWPADLIVMGSHGRRGFTKFLLGSVSEAVVSHAPCSVEIIKLSPIPDKVHGQG